MSFTFFNTLFPEPENGRDSGYVVLVVPFPESPTETTEIYFSWPSQRDDLVAYCLGNSDQTIWTVPALFAERGSRRAGNISHQWSAYAVAENLNLRTLRVEPTMVVEVSPKQSHLYWVTSEDNPQKMVEVSRSIAQAHHREGCDLSGWDAGQLLTVPGTTTHGYESELKRSNPLCSLKSLQEMYPTLPSRQEAVGEPIPDKGEWFNSPTVIRDASKVLRDTGVSDLFGSSEGRSHPRLLAELSRRDVEKKTALYIAWNAACNTYRTEGRHPEDLWSDLCAAYDNPANAAVRNSIESDLAFRELAVTDRTAIEQNARNPERRAEDFVHRMSLLSDPERAQVPLDTFIDRYVEWAKTRTDAPEVYHRAGAVTLLTSVYGEFGECPNKSRTNLTLWFLQLGPTTRARKSTAMGLWVDILFDLMDEEYDYSMLSDATPEVLQVILFKKDGRTTVFYRDEAHGLLYEQDRKTYLTGLPEFMTELFEGRVRRRVRVSSLADDPEDLPKGKVRTNFVRFMCGTMEQMTDALTIKNYQSGELARFLFAEASPPPMTKESMRMEQWDGMECGEDIARTSLLHDLVAGRNFWRQRTGYPGRTVMIPFSQEAWNRLEDARWDIYNLAQNHDMSEALLPTTDRMGVSVMKCAVLIAMSEEKDRVEMRHLLKAISLAEEWYAAAAKIAGKIMHSSWAKRQDELLTAVRSRADGITQQELYRKYGKSMHEKDIVSDLAVLVKSAYIHKVDDRRGRVRYVANPLSRP